MGITSGTSGTSGAGSQASIYSTDHRRASPINLAPSRARAASSPTCRAARLQRGINMKPTFANRGSQRDALCRQRIVNPMASDANELM